jgi:Cu/Ag efflux pump CusA
VIVGGMAFGTPLTLYVVPTVYTLVRQWLDRGKPVVGPAEIAAAE